MSFMTVMRIKTSETLAHNYIISITLPSQQHKKRSNRSGKRSCLIVLQSLYRKSQSMMKAELPLSTGTPSKALTYQPTTSPRHEPNTPEPVSDPQCTIPLSTLTTTGTANQPQHCDDGTISPYPELRVHSGHTSMSVGTSTTTPNHFSLSTPKAIPFKQAPSTPHHTTGISYLNNLSLEMMKSVSLNLVSLHHCLKMKSKQPS